MKKENHGNHGLSTKRDKPQYKIPTSDILAETREELKEWIISKKFEQFTGSDMREHFGITTTDASKKNNPTFVLYRRLNSSLARLKKEKFITLERKIACERFFKQVIN